MSNIIMIDISSFRSGIIIHSLLGFSSQNSESRGARLRWSRYEHYSLPQRMSVFWYFHCGWCLIHAEKAAVCQENPLHYVTQSRISSFPHKKAVVYFAVNTLWSIKDMEFKSFARTSIMTPPPAQEV